METFYKPNLENQPGFLSEEESKHCATVLRKKEGDQIHLMNGKGVIQLCQLSRIDKKRCEYNLLKEESVSSKPFRIHLAIAPTKNADRMEWMIEKLQEIAVDEVTLLSTAHSERSRVRIDRLDKKAISAMKQSRHPFLMQINELTSLDDFISKVDTQTNLIAHLGDHPYLMDIIGPKTSTTILIGPEGDFSENEVKLAEQQGFKPVSLGHTTLRTETAGLMSCHFVNIKNSY